MTELNRRTAMFNRSPPGHPDLAVDAATQARLVDLTIDSIQPDPGNPRRIFNQAKLEVLAQSFATNGIIQPIVVRPGEGGATSLLRASAEGVLRGLLDTSPSRRSSSPRCRV